VVAPKARARPPGDPIVRLTAGRLRDAVRLVVGDPAYRQRARQLQRSIEAVDGLNRAADVIEAAFAGRVSQRIA
jgi:UDP:flavonoid glycosyltransferase YjiC (YdhE family)